jgi:transposase-like protein
MDCPARGQLGEGNIGIHSRKRQRYWCKVCRKPFSARAGTIFYRRRTDEQTITRVITLVSHGCPVPAIEAAYGGEAQTVRDWMDASGAQCEAVHQAEVVVPRDLVQVQADEIHVKTQAGVLWMALAMMVSTRLWLGGAVSPHRDRDLIRRLVAIVAACAMCRPLLFVSDGLSTYIDVVRKAFRTRQGGTGGRPRLVGWPDLVIAQVVKLYAGRAVTGTLHRLVVGSVELFLTLLWSTPQCQVLNTAYIERLNGTFRSRLAMKVQPDEGEREADASDGSGYHRPCLERERTLALSGATPRMGAAAAARATIQGASGADWPVVSAPPFSIDLPRKGAGVVGRDGWLASSTATQGTFLCRLPGVTTAPRLDIHFWWNTGEIALMIPAASVYCAHLLEHRPRISP